MLSKSSKSPEKTRVVLIAVAIVYLVLILLAPAVNVFWQAFNRGWGPFIRTFAEADFISAVQLTVLVAFVVIPINTVFGLCAALALSRRRFWGRSFVLSLLDLPFSISPVVAGMMMILLYGNRGWFGSWLNTIGIKVIFGVPGIILATAFVTMPFVAREVIPVLEEVGSDQADAARTLGANEWQIFWNVTLPNIRWGLLYGVILTNARAMGEFGAVSVVSGNIARKTQTLPLFVEESYKQYATTSAFAAAVLLALLGLVTLILKTLLERQIAGKQNGAA